MIVAGAVGLVAVTGTCFVQLGDVPWLAVLASVPVGTLATAILVVNNLRDVDVEIPLGVLVAVLLNTKGLLFRGFYRALFILPVVIPPLIVATVWRNMFTPDGGAINFALQAVGGVFGIPADAPGLNLDWLRQP